MESVCLLVMTICVFHDGVYRCTARTKKSHRIRHILGPERDLVASEMQNLALERDKSIVGDRPFVHYRFYGGGLCTDHEDLWRYTDWGYSQQSTHLHSC